MTREPLYLHLDQPDERVRSAELSPAQQRALWEDAHRLGLVGVMEAHRRTRGPRLYGRLRFVAFLVVAGFLGYVGWAVLG